MCPFIRFAKKIFFVMLQMAKSQWSCFLSNLVCFCGVCRRKTANLQLMASGKTPGLTQEANGVTIDRENNTDVFDDMKQRFLAFKKLKYM